MDKSLRLGIDFGYKYTGVALLDSNNKVLDVNVLKHRYQISDKLLTRRSNRSQRRRKLSKIRRLRDLKALLKGMGIEPHTPTLEKRTITEREKASLGNRLYALAHYRGWDYASLLEMLLEEQDGKSPKCPTQVKKIDRILIKDFQAPVFFNEKGRKKYKKEDPKDYENAQQKAKQEIKKFLNSPNFSLSEETLPFAQIKHTCLGELYEKAKEIYELRKKLEKDSTDLNIEQKIEQKEEDYQNLKLQIQAFEIDTIKEYLKEKLKLIYSDINLTEDKQKEIVSRIMVELGLDIGEILFEQGKIYRPHKNRHRSKMIEDLSSLMKIACGQDKDKFDSYAKETLNRLKKSNFKEQVLNQEIIKKDWEQQINKVNQKAEEIAKKTNITSKEVKEAWIKSVKKIVGRQYRKKRFENRNSMGKCPAKTVEKKPLQKKCSQKI